MIAATGCRTFLTYTTIPMPLTALDPNTALLVIDLQRGILARPGVDLRDVIANAAALAGAFRRRDLPVVLVTAAGRAPGRTELQRPTGTLSPDFTEVLPELDRRPGDHLVTKHTWGAFPGTGLEAYLRGAGVTQVVVAGVATSFGVESTARQAYEHGFHVTLATDAMFDPSPEAHHHSVTRIFPKLGETGTTQEILDLLRADSPASV
ncbi:hydrolase [Gemmatimonadetes bacterium T265]|nr:hydrolase [Gemmatimonadetes bacterium T265]